MKILYRIKNINDLISFLWELPQNLLGLLLILTTKAWYSVAWEDCYFTSRIKDIYSLGRFIVLSDNFYNNGIVIKVAREYQKLSRKSGWLYLLIILFRKMGRKSK